MGEGGRKQERKIHVFVVSYLSASNVNRRSEREDRRDAGHLYLESGRNKVNSGKISVRICVERRGRNLTAARGRSGSHQEEEQQYQ